MAAGLAREGGAAVIARLTWTDGRGEHEGQTVVAVCLLVKFCSIAFFFFFFDANEKTAQFLFLT
jgi:hypothetical protein